MPPGSLSLRPAKLGCVRPDIGTCWSRARRDFARQRAAGAAVPSVAAEAATVDTTEGGT